ncbi:GntR family transcriptional regulator [uncultured Clostridium sp.]|uniref:GntR family transcriptional regulator n=1 Tax=uncultured Clostridium sp. TaxID=59620 RepID=UPI0028F147A0|nr:GntR family transcriptional regulator [uncultured Clostridium sp.]
MKIVLDNLKPIYIQIAEGIEDDILNDLIKEDEQVMSTNQFSEVYGINPATSRKGISILADEGILYKKRGIGMFVKPGAKEYIKEKRKKGYFNEFILKAIKEGKKIGISIREIVDMINDYGEGKNE